MIKRYTIVDGYEHEMYCDTEGNWVRYDDVNAIMKGLEYDLRYEREMIQSLLDEIREWKQSYRELEAELKERY